jgi:hemolysin III
LDIDMFATDGGPTITVRDYTKAEQVADGFVHVIGLAFAAAGVGALIVLSGRFAGRSSLTSTGIYATSLVLTLAFSAAYNMCPVCRAKWLLRRCDQAAIFLLIAGTYTAFLMQASDDTAINFALTTIWTVAILGVLLKLALRGRHERLSLIAYLALGWGGLVFVLPVIRVMPGTALCLAVLGGLLYSVGVIFHLWGRLRFQNVIWHGFVLVAAGCHYGAVLDCLLSARS